MEKTLTLIQFDRRRVEQYADRRNIPLATARYRILEIFGPRCNLADVDAEIDPYVDAHLQSSLRQLCR